MTLKFKPLKLSFPVNTQHSEKQPVDFTVLIVITFYECQVQRLLGPGSLVFNRHFTLNNPVLTHGTPYVTRSRSPRATRSAFNRAVANQARKHTLEGLLPGSVFPEPSTRTLSPLQAFKQKRFSTGIGQGDVRRGGGAEDKKARLLVNP